MSLTTRLRDLDPEDSGVLSLRQILSAAEYFSSFQLAMLF